MPYNRRKNPTRDLAEPAVVAALRASGCLVLRELPTDLLVYCRGQWKLLEVKTPTATGKVRKRNDQQEQADFCRDYDVPYITTAEAALRYLGLTDSGDGA